MLRCFSSHLSPAPVSTRIVFPAARISRQFIASKIRLRSSACVFFSHIGFGTTPNIAPPSRRRVPSVKTKNSRSPSLNVRSPSPPAAKCHSLLNKDRAAVRRLRQQFGQEPRWPQPRPRLDEEAFRATNLRASLSRARLLLRDDFSVRRNAVE